ncbi:MAG TPA: hypothetical protein VHN18_03525, partial [Micromonosporaceae bacterium]|nr:hypothetical protein [Micromonosporaceae bacterium]
MSSHAQRTEHDDAGYPRRRSLTLPVTDKPRGRPPRGCTVLPVGSSTSREDDMADHRKLGRELELFATDPLAG